MPGASWQLARCGRPYAALRAGRVICDAPPSCSGTCIVSLASAGLAAADSVSECTRESERVSERALSLVRQVSVLFLMLDTVLWHGLCTSSVRQATADRARAALAEAHARMLCALVGTNAHALCLCPHCHSEGAGGRNGVRGSTHSVGWAG
jgi:hypothetical protein